MKKWSNKVRRVIKEERGGRRRKSIIDIVYSSVFRAFIRYYTILRNPPLCLVRVYDTFAWNAVMNFSIEKLLTFTVVITVPKNV